MPHQTCLLATVAISPPPVTVSEPDANSWAVPCTVISPLPDTATAAIRTLLASTTGSPPPDVTGPGSTQTAFEAAAVTWPPPVTACSVVGGVPQIAPHSETPHLK